MYNIVDLTQTVDENIPIYPGDCEFNCTAVTTVQNNLYRISRLTIGSHCGTHADAPCHFIENGKGVSELVLEHFIGNAFVINAPYNSNEINAKYITDNLENANGAKILIIKTGWEQKLGTDEYFTAAPHFTEDITDSLLGAGIITLCTDMPTVADNISQLHLHTRLLGNGIAIVEGLVNLNALTKEHVFFSAAPVKLAGCDGSPVRAYSIER